MTAVNVYYPIIFFTAHKSRRRKPALFILKQVKQKRLRNRLPSNIKRLRN
jgi:hypothetical protein